jgi:hypothetical protein
MKGRANRAAFAFSPLARDHRVTVTVVPIDTR